MGWAYGRMGVWAYGRMGYGMGYGIGMGLWDLGWDGVGLGLGYGRMGFGILPNPLVWAANIYTYICISSSSRDWLLLYREVTCYSVYTCHFLNFLFIINKTKRTFWTSKRLKQ